MLGENDFLQGRFLQVLQEDTWTCLCDNSRLDHIKIVCDTSCDLRIYGNTILIWNIAW